MTMDSAPPGSPQVRGAQTGIAQLLSYCGRMRSASLAEYDHVHVHAPRPLRGLMWAVMGTTCRMVIYTGVNGKADWENCDTNITVHPTRSSEYGRSY